MLHIYIYTHTHIYIYLKYVWRGSLSNVNSNYIIVIGLQAIFKFNFFILYFSPLTNLYYDIIKKFNGKICEQRGEFCSLPMS